MYLSCFYTMEIQLLHHHIWIECRIIYLHQLRLYERKVRYVRRKKIWLWRILLLAKQLVEMKVFLLVEISRLKSYQGTMWHIIFNWEWPCIQRGTGHCKNYIYVPLFTHWLQSLLFCLNDLVLTNINWSIKKVVQIWFTFIFLLIATQFRILSNNLQ